MSSGERRAVELANEEWTSFKAKLYLVSGDYVSPTKGIRSHIFPNP